MYRMFYVHIMHGNSFCLTIPRALGGAHTHTYKQTHAIFIRPLILANYDGLCIVWMRRCIWVWISYRMQLDVDQAAFKSIIIKIRLLFQIHVTILNRPIESRNGGKWARKMAQSKARNHTMKLSSNQNPAPRAGSAYSEEFREEKGPCHLSYHNEAILNVPTRMMYGATTIVNIMIELLVYIYIWNEHQMTCYRSAWLANSRKKLIEFISHEFNWWLQWNLLFTKLISCQSIRLFIVQTWCVCEYGEYKYRCNMFDTHLRYNFNGR